MEAEKLYERFNNKFLQFQTVKEYDEKYYQQVADAGMVHFLFA